jgi:hypothetical protein
MASPKSQKSVKENEENNKSEHSVEINFEEEVNKLYTKIIKFKKLKNFQI